MDFDLAQFNLLYFIGRSSSCAIFTEKVFIIRSIISGNLHILYLVSHNN